LGVLNEVEPNLKKLPFDSEGIKLYVTFTKPRCICGFSNRYFIKVDSCENALELWASTFSL